MLDSFSRGILRQRPNIRYVSPPSEDVIPEPQVEAEPSKPERVQKLVNSFKAIEKTALLVENAIADRAKDVSLTLDLSNPEDFVAAQAAGRSFPEAAEDIGNGILVVKVLTFDMYHKCVKAMKEHGKERGTANEIPSVIPSMTKTDFGGMGENGNRRPDLNQMSIPFAPIDLVAFIATAVPILFTMLFPLIQTYVKGNIIGHIHADPTSGVVGPGIPGPIP